MATWQVAQGFGDIEDMPNCWGVSVYKKRFTSAKAADEFAARAYERNIKRIQKQQPDWWKSYWVAAMPAVGVDGGK